MPLFCVTKMHQWNNQIFDGGDDDEDSTNFPCDWCY